jgi:hypothetical protein
MNKKVLALLLMSICITGLTACSNKKNIDEPKNNTPTKITEKVETKPETKLEEKIETKPEEKTEEKSEVKVNTPSRYSVAGIDDAAEFERVFKTIQSLVAKGEKEKVAEYVSYPLTRVNITANNREEFIKNYDSIMTEKVKSALVNQKVEETFVNYKGVMAGAGEVWFTVTFDSSSKAPKYLIYAINQP